MDAFVLEELHRGTEWRRDGRIFWARADAERYGRMRLQRRTIHSVRLIPVRLDLAAGYALERDEVPA